MLVMLNSVDLVINLICHLNTCKERFIFCQFELYTTSFNLELKLKCMILRSLLTMIKCVFMFGCGCLS